MSACVSRHGEYSEHTLDDKHTCTRCLVLDEDALRADLDAVRKRLADARDILRAATKPGAAGPRSTDLLDVARWAADTIRAQYRHLIEAERRDQPKPDQVTYRLPDWLGGHEVAEILRDTDAGVLVVVDTGAEQTRIAVPRSVLVEVRPPSIDDPVTLPLNIEAANAGDLSIPASIAVEEATYDKAIAAGAAVYLGAMCSYLTAEQARDAARALWKLGTAPSTKAGA